MTDNEILKIILEKLSSIENNISNINNDISALKLTALKVEHELIPNVQILLENHSNIAKKEVDLIKKRLETFTA